MACCPRTRAGSPLTGAYAEQRQMGLDEIKGGSPYGASTIAGASGERTPSEQELGMAAYQGKHVTTIATKLLG
jgi:NAD(P)H dehydrogenase (quinone)